MIFAPPAARYSISGPSIDRRHLLKGAAFGGAIASAGVLHAQSGVRGFTHGVASGEPTSNSVLLWTRFAADADAALRFEVAETAEFATIVSGGEATSSPDNDHCAKAVASGLEPDQWYYYRFIAPDGAISDIGRTRTLPEGPTERFRIGVFSCSNIGFGWFNAYAHAAEANDLDLLYHAGDYFYEYPPGVYPGAAEAVRWLPRSNETVRLEEYRARFAHYRSDPDLRRLHQMYPMIAGWDDHESANDSWEGGAENHQSETEGSWAVRKGHAKKAYREWMPVSDNPWQAYEIGDLATIFRLETRLTARAEPLSLEAVLKGKTSPEDAMAALTEFRDGAYADPSRQMLGASQERWLAEGFKASRSAGKTWQVVAQQVLMGKLATPTALLADLPDEIPDFARQRLLAAGLASAVGLPLNMDAWDGYDAARGRLLSAAQEAEANLISLAGDTHNAWAFEMANDGAKAGVEFGGQSVSSPGLEGYLAAIGNDRMQSSLVGHNQELAWADTARRGYFALELTPAAATAEYRFTGSPKQRSARLAGTHRIASAAGSHSLTAG